MTTGRINQVTILFDCERERCREGVGDRGGG